MTRDHGWFRVAKELGMSLDECMEKHTERQLLLWLTWLGQEQNRPTINEAYLEAYLMRVCYEIRILFERVGSIFGGKASKVNLEDFRVTFGEGNDKPRQTREEAAAIAKMVWGGVVGPEIVHKTRTRTEARAMGLID